MFFFLPENASFADVPGLVRDLRSEVDLKFAERIARAGSDGRRVLLIQATDVDLGTGRAFDAVAAAREAVATGEPKLFSDILLASAAIPGAFPPREIQGRLYADGGITSNFFYGGSHGGERHLWRDMAARASQRADSEDALLGDHQRVHSADSGHVAADMAGDRRPQHLRVDPLGGSDRAASSIRDRGGDEVTR